MVNDISRLIGLGVMIGVIAGTTSAVFLIVLDSITEFHSSHGWLIALLPVFGGVWGLALDRFAGTAAGGSQLIFGTIRRVLDGRRPRYIPHQMAAWVLSGTWLAHLVGASVGREGTALQMSASLTDALAERTNQSSTVRRSMLIASLAGGFGAVFGVPIAGVIFSIEATKAWRPRPQNPAAQNPAAQNPAAQNPAHQNPAAQNSAHQNPAHQKSSRDMYLSLAASIPAAAVGYLTVGLLGHKHGARAPLTLLTSPIILVKLAIFGVACGAISAGFVWLRERSGTLFAGLMPKRAFRMALGGAVVWAMLAVAGFQYRGLSLGLLADALAGRNVADAAFAIKLVITAIALGLGFPGGEVTPLFVVGTTFGATVSGVAQIPSSQLAALGFTAVFAAAARAPLSGVAMAVELFGLRALVPSLVVCASALVTAHPYGIYATSTAEIEEL